MTEAQAKPQAAILRQGSIPNLNLCVAGYALGVIGWVMDWLGHMQITDSYEPGHRVMEVALFLIALSILPWEPTRNARIVRAVFFLGMIGLVAVPEVGPLLGLIAMLVVVVAAVRRRSGPRTLADAPVYGALLAIAASIIDIIWHIPFPPDSHQAENVALLPGHLLQFIAYVLGTIGVAMLIRRTKDAETTGVVN